MSGSLYIIAAPSGAGKTTLVKAILDIDSAIRVSVSTTTRDIRPGEKDGINYHFKTINAFQAQVNSHDFLEHAQVFDNFYGTSKSSVEQQLAEGFDVILEIDWQGAQQVKKLIPAAIGIFILPPTRPELEKRLTGRATDSQEIIDRRMKDAVSEMKHYNEFDFIIINDDFNIALNDMHSVFTSNRLRLAQQEIRQKALITSLLS